MGAIGSADVILHGGALKAPGRRSTGVSLGQHGTRGVQGTGRAEGITTGSGWDGRAGRKKKSRSRQLGRHGEVTQSRSPPQAAPGRAIPVDG
jgi:hypothetical protein